jgi:hypothetical protein
MTNTPTSLRPTVLLAAMLCGTVTAADAQTRVATGKWQVDVYAGASKTSGGTDGTAIGEFPTMRS